MGINDMESTNWFDSDISMTTWISVAACSEQLNDTANVRVAVSHRHLAFFRWLRFDYFAVHVNNMEIPLSQAELFYCSARTSLVDCMAGRIPGLRVWDLKCSLNGVYRPTL